MYHTHTSWSELLYIKAFWNMSSMSLWNSMSVVVNCPEKQTSNCSPTQNKRGSYNRPIEIE